MKTNYCLVTDIIYIPKMYCHSLTCSLTNYLSVAHLVLTTIVCLLTLGENLVPKSKDEMEEKQEKFPVNGQIER